MSSHQPVSSTETAKPKATRVRRVCMKCRVSHQSCGPERPCKRCALHGFECVEAPAQKRGRKALAEKAADSGGKAKKQKVEDTKPSKTKQQQQPAVASKKVVGAQPAKPAKKNVESMPLPKSATESANLMPGGQRVPSFTNMWQMPGADPAMMMNMMTMAADRTNQSQQGSDIPTMPTFSIGSGSGMRFPYQLGTNPYANMMQMQGMMTGSQQGSGAGMLNNFVGNGGGAYTLSGNRAMSGTQQKPAPAANSTPQLEELVNTVQMLVKNQSMIQKTLFDMMVQGNANGGATRSQGRGSQGRGSEQPSQTKSNGGPQSTPMPFGVHPTLSRLSWGSFLNQGMPDNWSYGKPPAAFSSGYGRQNTTSVQGNDSTASKGKPDTNFLRSKTPSQGPVPSGDTKKTADSGNQGRKNSNGGSAQPSAQPSGAKTLSARGAKEGVKVNSQTSSRVKELVAQPECPIDTSAVTGEKSTKLSFSDACSTFKVRATEMVKKFMTEITGKKAEPVARKLILQLFSNVEEQLKEEMIGYVNKTKDMKELTELVNGPDFFEPLPVKQRVAMIYSVFTRPTLFPSELFLLLKEFQKGCRAILDQAGSDPADIPCHMMSEMLENAEI